MRRLDLCASLAAGLLLVVGGLAVAALTIRDPAEARAMLAVAGTELLAGREAALTLGLATGLPWTTAAAITTTIELAILLLGYPFLVLAGDWVRERAFVRRALRRAAAFAKRRPTTGVLMLGAITLAPFIPVGALTSVLVGEVLRLPRGRLLLTLAAANVLANLLFAYATSLAIGLFANPTLVAAIASGVLVALALGSMWWGAWRDAHEPAETETPM